MYECTSVTPLALLPAAALLCSPSAIQREDDMRRLNFHLCQLHATVNSHCRCPSPLCIKRVFSYFISLFRLHVQNRINGTYRNGNSVKFSVIYIEERRFVDDSALAISIQIFYFSEAPMCTDFRTNQRYYIRNEMVSRYMNTVENGRY